MFSEIFIQQLLLQLNITSVVGSRVALKRIGAVRRGHCPFHYDHVKNLYLVVYPRTQSYYCQACGEKGDAIKFIMEIDGVTFTQAVVHLCHRYGIPMYHIGNRGIHYESGRSVHSRFRHHY